MIGSTTCAEKPKVSDEAFSSCKLNTSPKLGTYTPVPSNLSSAGVLGLF